MVRKREKVAEPPPPSSDRGDRRVGDRGVPSVVPADHEATATRRTETNVSAPISTRKEGRPTLTVIVGADAGRVLRITDDEVTIGRSQNCTLVLPDLGVSRRHARLLRTNNGFVLEDLRSKNGTFVDGERVHMRRIAHGEAFQVGPHVLIRFDLMTPAEESLSKQLYESSMRDALTRAYNRRYMSERMTAEIAFAARHHTELSLVLFDFDHFKRVNDTFGHAAGDGVLQQGAARVLSTLRSEDVLARIGGEEFAYLLRGIGYDDAVACAERVRRAIEVEPIVVGEASIPITISLGVASLDDCEETPSPEELFGTADRRLYDAKRSGRNRVGRRK